MLIEQTKWIVVLNPFYQLNVFTLGLSGWSHASGFFGYWKAFDKNDDFVLKRRHFDSSRKLDQKVKSAIPCKTLTESLKWIKFLEGVWF